MVEGSSAPGSGYLTPERIMMRDTARKFTAEEVTPLANKLDPEHGDIPRELILKMGELGFHGILIPEEYGGAGLGISAASAVPRTRARIFANAVSRLVEVSSLNGEKPQSSVVPSCSIGM